MTSPPALTAQPVSPYGTWEPSSPPAMTWTPAAGYTGPPRGPLLDQVHDTGRWQAGPGAVMTWIPTDAQETQ